MTVKIGIIGMGGFADCHHQAVRRLEKEGVCKLVCTCDPALHKFSEQQRQWQFPERGVQIFTDFIDMLDNCRGQLDMVTIPTPIPLHASMHRACVERKLPVYLEKPPTLDPEEFEDMLRVEAQAERLTNVGFNFILEPVRQAIKQRIVDGEFGKVQEVQVFGHWPRGSQYYSRANWAGRLALDNRLVLDSPLGNAMAHYVHNAMFWCGQEDTWAWGELDEVRAELYRAHPIEGTDTVFVETLMKNQIIARLALSHACTNGHDHSETVICDHARIICTPGAADCLHRFEILWNNGRREQFPGQPEIAMTMNLRAYCQYLKGGLPRPGTRLADCATFVKLNALAYLAAGDIGTIPAPFVTTATTADGTTTRAINGIEQLLKTFLTAGQFPSAQGIPWGRAGKTVTDADLPHLPQAIRQMLKTPMAADALAANN